MPSNPESTNRPSARSRVSSHPFRYPRSSADLSRSHSLQDYLRTPDDRPIPIEGHDNVAWHVSAGQDYTPIVTWAKGYAPSWKDQYPVPTPGLHIFTCLNDDDEAQLMAILKSREKILCTHRNTQISIIDYELVRFGDAVPLTHNKRHADFGRGETFSQENADGFYASVLITDLEAGYEERTRLLYLFSENIVTFDYFIERGWVTVRFLAASCEGLAFGGCRRSIFNFLEEMRCYEDNPHCDIQWVIAPDDLQKSTNRERLAAENASGLHSEKIAAAAGHKGSVFKVRDFRKSPQDPFS